MSDFKMPDVDAIRRSLPVSGTERELLNGFLDYHRATILKKIIGANEEAMKRPSSPPSTLNLFDLVKHLALNETWWFQVQFAGLEVGLADIFEPGVGFQ